MRRDDAHALAGALTGVHEGDRVLGVMSIVRQGSPFESGQRELFRYLLGQASTSVENVDLHEMVSEQAITDELTGLSNQRRFRELVGKEAARAQRFGHELALLILDIDDFKPINDTYGHLQGDEVLKELGRILLDESRGVDEPARYGGEEFVLALPETDVEGALEVAERIRRRIEAASIPPHRRVRDGRGHRQHRVRLDARGRGRHAGSDRGCRPGALRGEAKRQESLRAGTGAGTALMVNRGAGTGGGAANLALTRMPNHARCGKNRTCVGGPSRGDFATLYRAVGHGNP